MRSTDDFIVASLLALGIFFPTSVRADFRESLVGAAFAILSSFFVYLFWKYGTRPRAVFFISLPILMVLSLFTLASLDIRFGWGILASYGAIAAALALNLKYVHPGKATFRTFIVVNFVWVAFGIAAIAGVQPVTDFLTSWYSQFYPELVPSMFLLHKPVLTFATHSLAGFFTYLFFWLNWETYKSRRIRINLAFALCEFLLLFAIFSFTSLFFAALACTQIALWTWRNNRRVLLTSAALIAAGLLFAWRLLGSAIDLLWQNPEFTGVALNTEGNGLLARYGEGGALRGTLDYLAAHPFRPLGFTFPTFLMTGDSGIVQYLVRGSIPLLLLIYIGLFQFLKFNSSRRPYVLTLFFVFLAFEVGFDVLPYFRTLFLLPFIVVYLKDLVPSESPELAAAG